VLPNDIDQPVWLDGRVADAVVSFANGLLEIGQHRLIAHSPLFFNQTSVPFDYDASAPQPQRWLKFLHDLWPNEPDAIAVLQQWFGYVISGRTDLHKIMLMVGPTRGGKGVIARVLIALLGRKNVAGPTLNSLGGEFGLAPLIGKSLAVISDARFAGRDASVVVERLLSISGEDTLTVNRKYRDQWTGKLPSRLHVLSNELPKLGDASTAIVGRIILLLLSHSWLNKEDHTLEPALHAELSGILNWALTGLQQLTIENGNAFTRLASADQAITAMRDLASPVAAFVREQCELGADLRIAVDDLYAASSNKVRSARAHVSSVTPRRHPGARAAAARGHAIPAAGAVRRRQMAGAHGIGRAARHPQRCRAVGTDTAVNLHAAAAIDDGAVHDPAGEPIRRVAGPASGIDDKTPVAVEFSRGAHIGRLRQDRRRDRGGKQNHAGGVAHHPRPSRHCGAP
jgi:P4 family phage/plasmid primase-like protien